jgi:hypothetical protein
MFPSGPTGYDRAVQCLMTRLSQLIAVLWQSLMAIPLNIFPVIGIAMEIGHYEVPVGGESWRFFGPPYTKALQCIVDVEL